MNLTKILLSSIFGIALLLVGCFMSNESGKANARDSILNEDVIIETELYNISGDSVMNRYIDCKTGIVVYQRSSGLTSQPIDMKHDLYQVCKK